jgi:hypothetical protein
VGGEGMSEKANRKRVGRPLRGVTRKDWTDAGKRTLARGHDIHALFPSHFASNHLSINLPGRSRRYHLPLQSLKSVYHARSFLVGEVC